MDKTIVMTLMDVVKRQFPSKQDGKMITYYDIFVIDKKSDLGIFKMGAFNSAEFEPLYEKLLKVKSMDLNFAIKHKVDAKLNISPKVLDASVAK